MFLIFLKQEYARRKKANPRYSLRAFARTLGLDSSTLTRVLREERAVSLKLANRILAKLEIDSSQKSSLLLSLHASAPDPAAYDALFRSLDRKTLEALDGWEYSAILSLMEVRGFRSNPKWISKSLDLNIVKTREALRRLETAGLISKRKSQFVLAGAGTTSPSVTSPETLRKIHHEYLERAQAVLGKEFRGGGDFSGVTIAISGKKLTEARRRITEFRRSLAEYLAREPSGEMDRVYRLNIQFIPLFETGDE
jgi:uncharacterized protein (TIGR02147 family)